MCEGDGYTKEEIAEVLERLGRIAQNARIANGPGSIDGRYNYTVASIPYLRRCALALVETLTEHANYAEMALYQLADAISDCTLFMNTYAMECKSLMRWEYCRNTFEAAMLDLTEKEASFYLTEKEASFYKEAAPSSPAPRFLILMTDDNQVIRHPLIEIKEGQDTVKAVDEVIQDLVVDYESEVAADIAHTIKAVEVQFVANHSINTKFIVTGF